MSRELKFRAWVNEHWVDWLPSSKTLGAYNEVGIYADEYNTENKCYIEQYTGLKDKNGEEIYEGDIVKFDCGDQTPAEVVYQEGSYFLKALDDGTLFYDPDADKPCPLGWFKTYGLEIIGNIHENPELLGGVV